MMIERKEKMEKLLWALSGTLIQLVKSYSVLKAYLSSCYRYLNNEVGGEEVLLRWCRIWIIWIIYIGIKWDSMMQSVEQLFSLCCIKIVCSHGKSQQSLRRFLKDLTKNTNVGVKKRNVKMKRTKWKIKNEKPLVQQNDCFGNYMKHGCGISWVDHIEWQYWKKEQKRYYIKKKNQCMLFKWSSVTSVDISLTDHIILQF